MVMLYTVKPDLCTMMFRRGRVLVLCVLMVLGVYNLLSSLLSVVTVFKAAVSPAGGVRQYTVPEPVVTGSPSLAAPLVMVVCEAPDTRTNTNTNKEHTNTNTNTNTNTSDPDAHLRDSWQRQAQQVETLLRTLLYFSRSAVWRIIVLTDTVATFHKVVKANHNLQADRLRLQLERQPVWLPQHQSPLRHHWRPCVWAKQFLAEALPDEDAVVYVDTDVVFLGPGEDLWSVLWSLAPHQALALAPEPQYQRDQPSRPFAGRVGLNTGIMVANLTRLRQLPGGGLGSAILQAGPIWPPPRHDQDALNHYLSTRPSLVREMSSRWNFMPSACFPKAPPCPQCFSDGITVLHGADATFHRNIDRKFLEVYRTMVRVDSNKHPRTLLGELWNRLAMVERFQDYVCADLKHLNHALTRHLTDTAITRLSHPQP